MKSTWNNGQGSRDRQSRCVLVTPDGNVHQFTGASIPGVCHAVELDYRKNGKWSNSTYQIEHAETTAVVQWSDDWDTGRVFPQPSWEAGYFWLAERAPMLTREGFEAYIRAVSRPDSRYHDAAQRWDVAREAEAEFGFAATPEQVATMRDAAVRIAAEKAKYEAEQEAKRQASPFAVLMGWKRA